MQRLQFCGTGGYAGLDGRRRIKVKQTGTIIVVRDAKAEQLLRDFPADWKPLGPPPLAADTPNVVWLDRPPETSAANPKHKELPK